MIPPPASRGSESLGRDKSVPVKPTGRRVELQLPSICLAIVVAVTLDGDG